jgi:OmpA-OmpF porin, OOP family
MKYPYKINMTFKKIVLLLTAYVFFGTMPLFAQSSESAASNLERSIQANYQGYQIQQAAIQALNDSGKYPVGSYALAKAQCWLDVSFHEFTRNDRSQFVPQALAESVKLTQAMKYEPSTVAQLAAQTALINNTDKVRQDLWARAEQVKLSVGFGGYNNCAEKLVACAEVELVHASNEYKQQGWRHSRPYIQIAEDNLNQAAMASNQCSPNTVREIVYVEKPVVAPPAPVVPAAAPVITVPVAAVQPTPFVLGATVLFNYNKNDLKNVRLASKQQLDIFIENVKSAPRQGMKIQSIQVTGHADRANGTGISDYNAKLSQARAETIKQYLIAQGVASEITTVAARGDTQQVEACNKSFKTRADLQECLLPNRRVELVVKGEK